MKILGFGPVLILAEENLIYLFYLVLFLTSSPCKLCHPAQDLLRISPTTRKYWGSLQPLCNLVATWSNYKRVATFSMKNLVTVFVAVRLKTCGFVPRELLSQLWVQWFWSQTSSWEIWRCKLKDLQVGSGCVMLLKYSLGWKKKKGDWKAPSSSFHLEREPFTLPWD